MIKNIILIVFAVFVFSGCALTGSSGGKTNYNKVDKVNYSFIIPTPKLNDTLKTQYPTQQTVSYGAMKGTLYIKDPVAYEQNNNDKLVVVANFKFVNYLFPKGLNGIIDITSGIRFEVKSKKIFFKNLKVRDIKFENFSSSKYITYDPQEIITKLIAKTVLESLSKKYIYNLSQDSKSLGTIESVKVYNSRIFVNLGL